jgi:hypothetical protein
MIRMSYSICIWLHAYMPTKSIKPIHAPSLPCIVLFGELRCLWQNEGATPFFHILSFHILFTKNISIIISIYKIFILIFFIDNIHILWHFFLKDETHKKTGSKIVCRCFGRLEFFFFKIFFGGIFYFFIVLYSTLLHLPPLRFHCADGCWDRTQDRCNWCIGSQTL